MPISRLLHANAVFSLATGALLTLAPSTVGRWLGLEIDTWIRLIGVVLVGHAGLLVWAARQDSAITLARLNIAAIGPYPILMVVLAFTGIVDTGVGRGLVVIDGAIVGLLAIMQWSNVRATTS